ncbi:HpcH/HpaI aldolase/citrate lyase family protein [Streptomyces sp. NPDC059477]|uniref:HpcH/HpaI aldolase/citrate lyase family protein n=1 Tax=Streptomyces sp. NPDC059477 TaxID=3346847 RepID=UPI0036978FB3
MSADMFARGPAWLFCPADRPDRYAKAAVVADLVILDLEDGVSASRRAYARNCLREAGGSLDPDTTVLRINPVGTAEHDRDLELLADLSLRLVMLAKAEHPHQLDHLRARQVIALCETPAGILNAAAIAQHATCAGLMWGAEDLIVGIGGTSSRQVDGRYRDVAMHARSSVLLAAAAAGKPALDSVVFDIADAAGLTEEAADAAACGFAGKVCIHPHQVPLVRTAFRPEAGQREWASAVLEAAEREGDGGGAFAFRGQMVDEPVLRRARGILSRAHANRPG